MTQIETPPPEAESPPPEPPAPRPSGRQGGGCVVAGLGCLVSLVLGSLGLVLLFGLWYQSTMGREATLAQIAPTVFLLVLAAIVLIPSARVALRD